MPYEEAEILKFFGLDTAGGTDPAGLYWGH